MMPLKTRPWDIVDRLQSEAAIAAYLDACLEDGDPKLVGDHSPERHNSNGITTQVIEVSIGADGGLVLLKNLAPERA